MTGVLVRSVYGTPLVIPEAVSYWAVKLQSGKWCTERDIVVDTTHPMGQRPFDWTLDLVGTGDIRRIVELWLLCPQTRFSPAGSTGRLLISERGTPFQFKVKSTSGFSAARLIHAQRASQVIGRISDKVTGDCLCFIWDHELEVLSAPWKSNIYQFGTWREGIAPLGTLSQEVLGVHLS